MAGKTVFRLFAVAPPGLEPVVAWELAQLGARPQVEAGGVNFKGDLRLLYRANLWLRTASRLLLRVADFRALHLRELVQRVARYPWEIYVPEGFGVKIRATCARSRLYHSGAVAERVLKGMERRLGRSLDIPEPGVLIVVRVFRDRCLISVDTSGEDLFKRGYKVGKGPAPLRENLAAGLLLASGWDRRLPVFDPFCGTGTIAIEAALILANQAPGLNRRFIFENWRNFDRGLWEELREEARKVRREDLGPVVYASDKSPGAISAAKANAKAAGVEKLIHFELCEIERLFPPTGRPGWMVTNPPYGRRLRPEASLKALFATLGRVFKERFLGWRLAVLSPFRETAVLLGWPVKEVTSFPHGGLRVRVFSSAPGEIS